MIRIGGLSATSTILVSDSLVIAALVDESIRTGTRTTEVEEKQRHMPSFCQSIRRSSLSDPTLLAAVSIGRVP